MRPAILRSRWKRHLSSSLPCLSPADEACIDINAFVGLSLDAGSLPRRKGKLSGLKIAVKDNICTKQFPTTCSSLMLRNFSSNYNATVVDLLEREGAIVIGKTNCDEFGMGSANVNTYHGPVLNPWDLNEKRSAGGSSGGSAAAIASDSCFGALSTDTGGSTRLPAAYCGIVGFKPSYGVLSRHGVIAFADSLDCVGIMAKRVTNVKAIFDVLNVYDPQDPTAVSQTLRTRACLRWPQNGSSGRNHLKSLRIGIPQEYFPSELEPQILENFRAVLNLLRRKGVILRSVSLPHTRYALSAYYILASAEASSNLARYDGYSHGAVAVTESPLSKFSNTIRRYAASRTRNFGPEVKRRIMLGTYALTAEAYDNYFLKASSIRRLIQRDFDNVYTMPRLNADKGVGDGVEDGIDLLLHPSAIRTAPTILEANRNTDRLNSYVQDILTVPASLAYLPAINIPSGVGHDGWPIGVSLVGQRGSDDLVLAAAECIEACWAKDSLTPLEKC